MVVAKYPATHGHTTVIDNLCLGLSKLGYTTAIGAFSFSSNPPNNIKMIKLSKFKLLTKGLDYLDFDIIHSHQPRVNYYLLFKKFTKPVILHYHGASNFIQRKNFIFMMKLFHKKISKIISVSKSGISQMENMIGHVESEVVYNGVDTSFYSPNLVKKYRTGSPELIFVSALREYKKTSFLINAMPKLLKKYPKAHLQIIGFGEEFESLKLLINKLNLQKFVELTGKITNDELSMRYASSDIYVSASQFEVCPVPTLEAMSSSKPLLLSDIEPHLEMIEKSKAGNVFHYPDFDDYLIQFEKIFSNITNFSNNALGFSKSVDWKIICEKTAKIYENLK
jgi:glycosyltransferase involved in cell wall biosynthesis